MSDYVQMVGLLPPVIESNIDVLGVIAVMFLVVMVLFYLWHKKPNPKNELIKKLQQNKITTRDALHLMVGVFVVSKKDSKNISKNESRQSLQNKIDQLRFSPDEIEKSQVIEILKNEY